MARRNKEYIPQFGDINLGQNNSSVPNRVRTCNRCHLITDELYDGKCYQCIKKINPSYNTQHSDAIQAAEISTGIEDHRILVDGIIALAFALNGLLVVPLVISILTRKKVKRFMAQGGITYGKMKVGYVFSAIAGVINIIQTVIVLTIILFFVLGIALE